MDAARQAITATVDAALVSGVCQEECGRLARYCLKMGLVLGELQLLMRGNEDLRGARGRVGLGCAASKASSGRLLRLLLP